MPPKLKLIKQVGNLQAVQFGIFEPFASRLRHGSFTRMGGVSKAPFGSLNTAFSTGDSRENVLANQKIVTGALGLDSAILVTPSLCHGKKVLTITESDNAVSQQMLQETDAVVTTKPGLVLFMSTADCSPVFFFEKKHGAIGLAHAGWRGIMDNIVGETINSILKISPASVSDIMVAVGPSIGPCCYKLPDPAQAKIPSWKKYLSDGGNNLIAIDLWTALEDQLLSLGVLAENISMARICTSCNSDLFFSYWTEKPKTGRFPSAIVKL